MTLHEGIALFLERGTAMQTFWGFYITVAIGLVALFANIKRSPRLPYLAALVSLGFIGFAWVNGDGITAIAKQREFFYGLLDQASSKTAAEIPILAGTIAQFKSISEPPTHQSVLYFHIGADIAVLVAIWALTLWRPEAKED